MREFSNEKRDNLHLNLTLKVEKMKIIYLWQLKGLGELQIEGSQK